MSRTIDTTMRTIPSRYRGCQELSFVYQREERQNRVTAIVAFDDNSTFLFSFFLLPFASPLFPFPWPLHSFVHRCLIGNTPFSSHSQSSCHCIGPRAVTISRRTDCFISFWHSGVFEYARVQRSRITVSSRLPSK